MLWWPLITALVVLVVMVLVMLLLGERELREFERRVEHRRAHPEEALEELVD